MSPIIELINEKKLVGKRMTMSYADYRVGELWANFMPRRKEITNKLTNDLISLVVYSSTHFVDFKATNEFERWATVEVASFDNVPDVMETFILSSGLNAVFHYTGLSTGISSFHQNIFNVWLPNSGYNLDNRAHFEVLGEKYKNNDPSSEEEIWIPIKAK
jgi:AraC family transcriptional regulator